MALGLLGYKVGMTQVYDDKGKIAPVTVLQIGPCPVLQIRTAERDGYEAVQVGFLDKPRRLASRSERGHVAKLDSKRAKTKVKAGVEPLAKAGCEPKRLVREFMWASRTTSRTSPGAACCGRVRTRPDGRASPPSVPGSASARSAGWSTGWW